MIEKPKKERRFLKALGLVGEILIQEVLIKIGSNLIKKIGGKKTLPSILFLLASLSLFAQYPATGNKQRLGYQTTGDGLVYRGRAADTVGIKSSGLNNAYFILDTVNNVLFNYIKTKGGWVFNNTDTVINNITVDTTSLSNRINLKLNISDTASMLAPYFKDLDTTSLNLTSRFAAKLNISDTASMLTNYLRTGTAASTYLSGSGIINYLPKFTGISTLGNSGLFTNLNRFSFNEGTDQSFGWDYMVNTSNPFIGNNVKTSTTNERVERMASTTYFNPAAIIFGFQRVNNSSGASSPGGMNFMTTSGNLAGDINPITYSRMFIEPDGNIGIGTMQPSYKFDIRGTLGVTGATTLSGVLNAVDSISVNGISTQNARFTLNTNKTGISNRIFLVGNTGSGVNDGYLQLYENGISKVNIAANNARGGDTYFNGGGKVGIGTTTPSATFEVHGSAVFNEGSTDSDFRVESDGNVNMVFVDASTDRVGIGTDAPTKTLDVNGTLVVTGIANFSNQITISGSVSGSNRLLGKNTSNNGIGDITIGTGLDLTSNNLTASGTDTTSLSNRINLKYDKTGGTISGAVTLSTTTATPTALLGKDGSNVVGTVTTVAQTGLMTRGETTATTGSPSATFTVTHGLGSNPSAVIVTSAGIGGAEKIIYEVYAKSSTTFSVQAWNYDGTEAASKSVKIYWLAIK